jgi:hypothetical protein
LFLFQQIKIAVGEEVVVRKPRVRDLSKRETNEEEEETTTEQDER